MNYSDINISVNINNIDFIIKSIEIVNDHLIGSGPIHHILILAETSYKNYNDIETWLRETWLSMVFNKSASIYKKDVIFDIISINRIFPIDIKLRNSGLQVTFSADYIVGDLDLFNLQNLRKRKLEKICQIN